MISPTGPADVEPAAGVDDSSRVCAVANGAHHVATTSAASMPTTVRVETRAILEVRCMSDPFTAGVVRRLVAGAPPIGHIEVSRFSIASISAFCVSTMVCANAS
ncbi:hypothetical protein GCM10017772_07240 [Promicromonospora soli]|uniref:Uncharacterized protein n=1 Tax=Promicromonospora soli TaxID=2035533 RepID=A0A919FJY6_9MICO|nr:hypothetical protein GCM10017772_07240 [Promicromonospora soli]